MQEGLFCVSWVLSGLFLKAVTTVTIVAAVRQMYLQRYFITSGASLHCSLHLFLHRARLLCLDVHCLCFAVKHRAGTHCSTSSPTLCSHPCTFACPFWACTDAYATVVHSAFHTCGTACDALCLRSVLYRCCFVFREFAHCLFPNTHVCSPPVCVFAIAALRGHQCQAEVNSGRH